MAATLIKADERQKQFASVFKGENFQNALRATLPKHLSAERLIRVVLSSMQNSPEILKCIPESIILSILRAASMGLEPDGGPLGQGYLVPFWNSKRNCKECQFIAGYRGLIKLARNSGEVADVTAEVVYDKDEFKYSLGLDPTLIHNRNDIASDPGPLKYVYAIARFRDGQKKFVVMNRREMEQIKDSSASRNKKGELVGPWVDWEAEMWKKSAVRRLAKLLPLSVEIKSNIEIEEASKPSFENALTFNVAETTALVPYDDPAEDVEETEQTSLDESFAAYQTEMLAAPDVITAQAVYDRWFNPDSAVDWPDEYRFKADGLRVAHQDAVRKSRGQKVQGQLMETSETAQSSGK